jgi:hypothetical protein
MSDSLTTQYVWVERVPGLTFATQSFVAPADSNASWSLSLVKLGKTISRPKANRSGCDGAARGPVISARLQFRRQRRPMIAFARMRPGVTACQMGNMLQNRGEKP